MIKIRSRKNIIAALLCLPLLSKAQESYTLKFMPELQQSQWVNASNQSDVKIAIGLPVISGTSFYLYNSGFAYNDLFHRVNDSTMAINPGDFISKLKKKNVLGFGADVSWISANVAFRDFAVGFSVMDKVDFRFTYPKDLLKFAWYGNGAFIGQTIDIGNFGLNASWYREYALHGTKNYGRWTFGASPKLLFGKTNINTKQSSLTLYTEPDYYAITAQAEMNLQTSGLADSTDRAQGNLKFPAYAFNKKNVGLGIDLGASYELNDKINLAAGINNLGYINWKSNVHNYTVGPKSFTFDGFTLDRVFQGDTDFISTDQYIDSVKDLIDFEKNSKSYKTTLPYEFYAMGTYQLNKYHTVGAQLSMQRFSKRMIYATTLCYKITLSKHFTGAFTYTMKSGSAFNLGGSLVLRLAGMQWYMATDNWWASVRPLASKNTNLHFGMNIAIGDRAKKKNELMHHHYHHHYDNPYDVQDRPKSQMGHEEDGDEDEQMDNRPSDAPQQAPQNK